MMKNAHLLRTCEYASGRLTNSPPWHGVAPYSSRRHSQDFGRLVPPVAGGIFEQPSESDFFSSLIERTEREEVAFIKSPMIKAIERHD